MKNRNVIYLFAKVPFDRIRKEDLLKEIIHRASKKRKSKILNMNAYGVITFLENKRYEKVMRSADINYPDGWGPVFASKYLDEPLEERANVGDFIDELLGGLDKKGLRVYFLGSEEKVVSLAVRNIKRRYKNLKVVGYHSGFYGKAKKNMLVKSIRDSKPNLVFIGMGLPKQEFFMYDNWEKLPKAVYMGVGGVFNYIAGTKSRAPVFMREIGLEWLYRLIQEPFRLGKRYTWINLKFLFITAKFYMTGKI